MTEPTRPPDSGDTLKASRPSFAVRRAGDVMFWPLAIVGLLIVGAGVALKLFAAASDFLVIALVAVGASLIPGNHVIDALRAWKGNGSGQ